MADNFIQEGKVIDFTNDTGSAISSGDVVAIGDNGDAILGVATVDIAIGLAGAVAIEGVFSVAKVSAAVITAGEFVVWDSSVSEFDDNAATPASGDVVDGAWAVDDYGAAVTTMNIKLLGYPATLTA